MAYIQDPGYLQQWRQTMPLANPKYSPRFALGRPEMPGGDGATVRRGRSTQRMAYGAPANPWTGAMQQNLLQRMMRPRPSPTVSGAPQIGVPGGIMRFGGDIDRRAQLGGIAQQQREYDDLKRRFGLLPPMAQGKPEDQAQPQNFTAMLANVLQKLPETFQVPPQGQISPLGPSSPFGADTSETLPATTAPAPTQAAGESQAAGPGNMLLDFIRNRMSPDWQAMGGQERGLIQNRIRDQMTDWLSANKGGLLQYMARARGGAKGLARTGGAMGQALVGELQRGMQEGLGRLASETELANLQQTRAGQEAMLPFLSNLTGLQADIGSQAYGRGLDLYKFGRGEQAAGRQGKAGYLMGLSQLLALLGMSPQTYGQQFDLSQLQNLA